jgi:hypothetical protein
MVHPGRYDPARAGAAGAPQARDVSWSMFASTARTATRAPSPRWQSAEEFGVRVHLIRRPGRCQAGDTHVGGHRFAANLVLLPHGLYYGPVTVGLAAAAIDAYQRGSVVVDRYRGRAGQPRADQEAEYARLPEGGALSLGLSACGLGAPG